MNFLSPIEELNTPIAVSSRSRTSGTRHTAGVIRISEEESTVYATHQSNVRMLRDLRRTTDFDTMSYALR